MNKYQMKKAHAVRFISDQLPSPSSSLVLGRQRLAADLL